MSTRLRIALIHGPNLNMLGRREPHLYGTTTLAQIRARTEALAGELGLQCDFRQTNHEGVLVDWIHEARTKACGVIINAGAYTHTSVAIHDALRALDCPIVEVHLSNTFAREEFRHHSLISPVAKGLIVGFGANSYVLAVDALASLIKEAAE